jgi:photosystem II stability/assembly factor-like uncharacterized protein
VALGLAVVVAVSTLAFTPGSLSWQLTPTGVEARFRGLSAVSAQVAWAGGSAGTVLRTTDRGRTWRNVSPPGVADLQFRDIEAFDARRAVVLAIGEGEASRIYVTSDGGAHWREAFRNDDPRAFYDCTAYFDQRRGLALSDPVDGKFRILATDDGGESWRVRPTTGMPAALPGEFAFAASGTCLVTSGHRDAWFATGGGAQARVFHSRDGGRSWQVTATPVRSGEAAGIFSLAFRDPRAGVAIGGDFLLPDAAVDALAHRQWWPQLVVGRRRCAEGLPVRGGMGAAQPAHRARRRPDRQRGESRRRPELAFVRHRQFRRGGLRTRRRLLGLRRGRPHRPPPPLTPARRRRPAPR